jgi:hypothetical protein
MASGFITGAFPSKVIVPLMDEAAKATPGQTVKAATPAASHNLFPVTRMLGLLWLSLNLVTVDAANRRVRMRRLYTLTVHPRNLRR